MIRGETNLSNRYEACCLALRPLGEPDGGLPRQHAGFTRGATHPNHALGQGDRFGAEVADAVPATWAYEMQHIGIVAGYPFQVLDRLQLPANPQSVPVELEG